MPVVVLFAGVPLASLARTVGEVGGTWQWILWAAGCVLTAVYLILWA